MASVATLGIGGNPRHQSQPWASDATPGIGGDFSHRRQPQPRAGIDLELPQPRVASAWSCDIPGDIPEDIPVEGITPVISHHKVKGLGEAEEVELI